MNTYNIQYAVICTITEEVHADSPEEAVRKIKDGQGTTTDGPNWDRPHPDTEFYVEELDAYVTV